MNITAGRYTIELKELGWWDKEEIKAIRLSATKLTDGEISGIDGVVLIEAKKREIQLAITSIKEGEKAVVFSDEWLGQLSQEEGTALTDAITSLDKKK